MLLVLFVVGFFQGLKMASIKLAFFLILTSFFHLLVKLEAHLVLLLPYPSCVSLLSSKLLVITFFFSS